MYITIVIEDEFTIIGHAQTPNVSNSRGFGSSISSCPSNAIVASMPNERQCDAEQSLSYRDGVSSTGCTLSFDQSPANREQVLPCANAPSTKSEYPKSNTTLTRLKECTTLVPDEDENIGYNIAIQNKPFPQLLRGLTEIKETERSSDQCKQKLGSYSTPTNNSQKDRYACGTDQLSHISKAESTDTTITYLPNGSHQSYHSPEEALVITTESQEDICGKLELAIGHTSTPSNSSDDSHECGNASAPITLPEVGLVTPVLIEGSRSTRLTSTQYEASMSPCIHNLQGIVTQPQSIPTVDSARSAICSKLRLDSQFDLQSLDKLIVHLLLYTKPQQFGVAVKYLSQPIREESQDEENFLHSVDRATISNFPWQEISTFFQSREEESSIASSSTKNQKQQSLVKLLNNEEQLDPPARLFTATTQILSNHQMFPSTHPHSSKSHFPQPWDLFLECRLLPSHFKTSAFGSESVSKNQKVVLRGCDFESLYYPRAAPHFQHSYGELTLHNTKVTWMKWLLLYVLSMHTLPLGTCTHSPWVCQRVSVGMSCNSHAFECHSIPEDQITLSITVHSHSAYTLPTVGVVTSQPVSRQFLHNNTTIAPYVYRNNFALETVPRQCKVLLTANSQTICTLSLPLSMTENSSINLFCNLSFCLPDQWYSTASSMATSLTSSTVHSPSQKSKNSIDSSEAVDFIPIFNMENLQDTPQQYVSKSYFHSEQTSTVFPYPQLISSLFQKSPSLDLRSSHRFLSSPHSHEQKNSRKNGNGQGQENSGNNGSTSGGSDGGGGNDSNPPSNSGSGGRDDDNDDKRNPKQDGKEENNKQQEMKEVTEDEDDAPSACKEDVRKSKEHTSYLLQKPEHQDKVERRLAYHGADTQHEDEEQKDQELHRSKSAVEERQSTLHAPNSSESLRPEGCAQRMSTSTKSMFNLSSTDLEGQPNPCSKCTVVNSSSENESRERNHMQKDDEGDKRTPRCKTEDKGDNHPAAAQSSTSNNENLCFSTQQHCVSSNVYTDSAVQGVLAQCPNGSKQSREVSNCPPHPKDVSLRVPSKEKTLVAFRNQESMKAHSLSVVDSSTIEPQQQSSFREEAATVHQQHFSTSQNDGRHAENKQSQLISPLQSSLSPDLRTPGEKEKHITEQSPVPDRKVQDRHSEVVGLQEVNHALGDVPTDQEDSSAAAPSNGNKPVNDLQTTLPKEKRNVTETSSVHIQQSECSEVIRPIDSQETAHEAVASEPLQRCSIKQHEEDYSQNSKESVDDPVPKKNKHTTESNPTATENQVLGNISSQALTTESHHSIAHPDDCSPALEPNSDQPVNQLQTHVPKEVRHITEQSPILEERSQEPPTEDHVIGETTTAAVSNEPPQPPSTSYSLEERRDDHSPDILYMPASSEESTDDPIPKEKRHITEFSPLLEEYNQSGHSEMTMSPPVTQMHGYQHDSNKDEKPSPHLKTKTLQGKVAGNQALEDTNADVAAVESPSQSDGMEQHQDDEPPSVLDDSSNVKRHITEQSPILEESKSACCEAQAVDQLGSPNVAQSQDNGDINTDVVMNNSTPIACLLPLPTTVQDMQDGLQSLEKIFHSNYENETEESNVDDAQNAIDISQQSNDSLVPVQGARVIAHAIPQVTACTSVLECQQIPCGNRCQPVTTIPVEESPLMVSIHSMYITYMSYIHVVVIYLDVFFD